jgi:Lrp/AsnC family transcriptional regulator, leucine-responsive regulatory protein
MHLDDVDESILQALKGNSRISLRKLAEMVHMTAPAVAERVRRLEEQQIITQYTILIDYSKFSPKLTSYIYISMKSSNNHHGFLHFVRTKEQVRECHRVSDDADYILKVEVTNQEELNTLLSGLLNYGNYRLNTVVSSIIKNEV